MDLTNRVVLIAEKYLKEDVKDRRFLCEGGFGCHSFTNGSKIFGRWLADNEDDSIDGSMVESAVIGEPREMGIKEATPAKK